jgi:arylsulfatase
MPPNVDYDMSTKAPHLRRTREQQEANPESWTLFEPRTYRAGLKRKQHGYLGCVSQVDRAVGEMLEFLDGRGLSDNTIVIYTADHGDYACEHGIIEKAPGICGDAICRVPSIWRWSGRFRAGQVTDRILQNVDLAPTLISLLGLDPMYTCDGEDVTRLLRGEDVVVTDFGVTEHPWSKSVLKGKWRLVYYPERMFADELGGRRFGELYDLDTDPWEMSNLYFLAEHQKKVRELERDLMDWLVTTTRIKTMLPWVLPREGGGGLLDQRAEADGKLSWKDVVHQGKARKIYL